MSILNKDALQAAKNAYAEGMGHTKVDGSVKPLSKITENAIESAILVYIAKDEQLNDLLKK